MFVESMELVANGLVAAMENQEDIIYCSGGRSINMMGSSGTKTADLYKGKGLVHGNPMSSFRAVVCSKLSATMFLQ
jgi:hypothetical protein